MFFFLILLLYDSCVIVAYGARHLHLQRRWAMDPHGVFVCTTRLTASLEWADGLGALRGRCAACMERELARAPTPCTMDIIPQQ